MDDTAWFDSGVDTGAGLKNVGTNSRAVARIMPMGLVSTKGAEEAGSLFADGGSGGGMPPGRKPGGGTDPLPLLP